MTTLWWSGAFTGKLNKNTPTTNNLLTPVLLQPLKLTDLTPGDLVSLKNPVDVVSLRFITSYKTLHVGNFSAYPCPCQPHSGKILSEIIT